MEVLDWIILCCRLTNWIVFTLLSHRSTQGVGESIFQHLP